MLFTSSLKFNLSSEMGRIILQKKAVFTFIWLLKLITSVKQWLVLFQSIMGLSVDNFYNLTEEYKF